MIMKKVLKQFLWVFIPVFLLWLGIGFYTSRYSLKLTEYEIPSHKLTKPIRIVQIADLHCTDFGQELPEMIKAQNPDLIVAVGDLVNMDEADISVALSTLRSLVPIAPVYVSMGNHETAYQDTFHSDLAASFSEVGVTVLDTAYEDIQIKDQTIRIGGIFGYCLPDNVVEAWDNESAFLYDYQETSHFKLLLAHMPVCWLINESLDFWDVDCVLSGHSHGGQVVLPFLGGLYAPDQGWFPEQIDGHFDHDNKHLVVTSGLGGTDPVPRFYNRPEVVVIDLVPH